MTSVGFNFCIVQVELTPPIHIHTPKPDRSPTCERHKWMAPSVSWCCGSICAEQGINFLMRMALVKMAFIPFGYVIDKWRYMVFRGDIQPHEYTSSWWQLRFASQLPIVPLPPHFINSSFQVLSYLIWSDVDMIRSYLNFSYLI